MLKFQHGLLFRNEEAYVELSTQSHVGENRRRCKTAKSRAAPQCCLLKVQRHEKADMAFQVLYYFTTNKKRQSHVRIKYYIKHNSD